MVTINGEPFGVEKFPNRETVYKAVTLNEKYNIIQFNWESNEDIVHLMMAVEYLKDKVSRGHIELRMPYVPYSAMDREIGDQLYTCKYFSNIVKKLGVSSVKIYDPHSEKATDLGVTTVMDLQPIINKVLKDAKPDFIYLPDKGAYDRYTGTVNFHEIKVFHGYKHRDLANKGKLSPEMQVDLCGISPDDLKGSRVLIVDDICRKGGTAYYAALNLHNLGVAEVYLYITHCEDVIEQGNILKDDEIKKVYTTDSEYAIRSVANRHSKVEIIPTPWNRS